MVFRNLVIVASTSTLVHTITDEILASPGRLYLHIFSEVYIELLRATNLSIIRYNSENNYSPSSKEFNNLVTLPEMVNFMGFYLLFSVAKPTDLPIQTFIQRVYGRKSSDIYKRYSELECDYENIISYNRFRQICLHFCQTDCTVMRPKKTWVRSKSVRFP